jgi:hypothetical protein
MLRKFCLVGLPILTHQATSQSAHIEDAYGMFVVLLSMLAYSSGEPYVEKADTWLQLPVQVELQIVLICGMLLNFGAETGTSAAMETAVAVVILGSCVPLCVVLVFAVLCPERVNEWAREWASGMASVPVVVKEAALSGAAVEVEASKKTAKAAAKGSSGPTGVESVSRSSKPPIKQQLGNSVAKTTLGKKVLL